MSTETEPSLIDIADGIIEQGIVYTSTDDVVEYAEAGNECITAICAERILVALSAWHESDNQCSQEWFAIVEMALSGEDEMLEWIARHNDDFDGDGMTILDLTRAVITL